MVNEPKAVPPRKRTVRDANFSSTLAIRWFSAAVALVAFDRWWLRDHDLIVAQIRVTGAQSTGCKRRAGILRIARTAPSIRA